MNYVTAEPARRAPPPAHACVCRHQLERANREKTAAEQRAVMRYNTELRAKEAEAVEHARALQSAQRLTEDAERKARQEQQAARGARTQLELEQVQVRRAVAGACVCVCVRGVCGLAPGASSARAVGGRR